MGVIEIMNTGLSDSEKESLLKFFLTHCEIKQTDDIETTFCPYEIKFFGAGPIHKEYGQLIIKAMDNLRNSALGF